MSTPLTKTEMALLRLIHVNPQGLFIGRITRHGMSIHDAASSYRSLNARGLLEKREESIFFTNSGRNWAFENQKLFAFSGSKPWRDTPESFRAPKLAPFAPYAPRISKLSKSAFKAGQQRLN